MAIKVVALDVYGTILARDDFDCCSPSRLGLEMFLRDCKSRGIKVVTSSDYYVSNVRNELAAAFRQYPDRGISLEDFDGFFQMEVGVKDFSSIITFFGIKPKELLVVGDDPDSDIAGANLAGANSILCPAYEVNGERIWSFEDIVLDL